MKSIIIVFPKGTEDGKVLNAKNCRVLDADTREAVLCSNVVLDMSPGRIFVAQLTVIVSGIECAK